MLTDFSILNLLRCRLLRILRKERAVLRALRALGLDAPRALDLLAHDAVAAAQSAPGALDALFDASDRLDGGGVVLWCNDLANDARCVSSPC